MNFLKKLMLPLVIVSTLVSSCAIFHSKEWRAQKHLSKAISLDPSIIQSRDSITTKDSINIKDSIVVHYKDSVNIVTKDSTIITPKSDLNGSISNPCDSNKLKDFDYALGSGVHKLRIWSENGSLKYSSTVDELVSTIHSRDTYIEHLEDSLVAKEAQYLKEKSEIKKDVVTIVKYRASIWQILMYIVAGAGIMYVLTRFKIIK